MLIFYGSLKLKEIKYSFGVLSVIILMIYSGIAMGNLL